MPQVPQIVDIERGKFVVGTNGPGQIFQVIQGTEVGQPAAVARNNLQSRAARQASNIITKMIVVVAPQLGHCSTVGHVERVQVAATAIEFGHQIVARDAQPVQAVLV